MPVRLIKQIFEKRNYLYIPIPQAIFHAYRIMEYRQLSGIVENHFNSDRTLSQKIGGKFNFKLSPEESVIILTDNPVTQEYGLIEGDYLEIILYEFYVRFQGGEESRTPLFPQRMIEYLEFDPNQSLKG